METQSFRATLSETRSRAANNGRLWPCEGCGKAGVVSERAGLVLGRVAAHVHRGVTLCIPLLGTEVMSLTPLLDFEPLLATTTPYSSLCSSHFPESCSRLSIIYLLILSSVHKIFEAADK